MEADSVVLLPDEVPGATLNPSLSIEDHSVQELQRLLECRKLKKNVKKQELIERVQNCIRAGRESNIFLGIDNGVWYDKKRNIQQGQTSSATVNVASTGSLVKATEKWGKFPSINIPKYFNRGHIYTYIVGIHFLDEEYEIKVETTTEKPFRRGHQYVDSDYIHNVMDKSEGSNYLLRADCYASFHKNMKYAVNIKLNSLSGAVISGECKCKASALGRCSHISALLLFLEKHCIQNGYSVLASTSKLREWGLGAKNKNPGSVKTKTYLNVKDPCIRDSFDPRPRGYVRDIYLNDFLADMQNNLEESLFETIFQIKYDDFDPDDLDIQLLKVKIEQFKLNMSNYFDENHTSKIFTVSGTEMQGSEEWHRIRRYFITASISKRVCSLGSSSAKKKFLMEHLWGLKTIHSATMNYGIRNEKHARIQYVSKILSTDEVLREAGLVVNKSYPHLACSVDGIVLKNNKISKIIEIKCPKILEKHDPNDFDKVLTRIQKSSFFLDKINGQITIKKYPPYLYQITTSMIIFEVNECDFVIWSPINILIFTINLGSIENNVLDDIKNKLKSIYYNMYVPEFFLMRIPRGLTCIELKE